MAGTDGQYRPYTEDLSLNRHTKLQAKSCRGRLPRLPACHDDGNAKRAGSEACPYEWPSDIRKALTLFDGLDPCSFPVRADTTVRPYTEDLSLNRQSRFRVRSCRGRLSRLPARNDDQNAKTADTEDCPYEWPSDIRKALTVFDGLNPCSFPVRADTAAIPYTEHLTSVTQASSITTTPSCAGGHGGPPLRRGFVVE